ncbi:MAG: hypothetical protein IK141_02805 [Clostridia bacterium]|nr:hypothetical protein [Clostridia bacterium]
MDLDKICGREEISFAEAIDFEADFCYTVIKLTKNAIIRLARRGGQHEKEDEDRRNALRRL